MPNLKDVAELAKVDTSTASRILNGDSRQAARPETRKRVFDAARTLGYRPNALARGLRTRRTGTVGFIIPSLDNVGFSEVTHGVQAAAADAGKLVMVVEAGALTGLGERSEEHYASLIADGRVDGLIVAFASLDDHLVALLAERGTPLVLVNRRTAGITGSVVVDDEAGISLAVRHLVSLGHRRIGYVGLDAQTDTAIRREAGYRNEMDRAGLAVDPAWVANAPPTEFGGHEAIRRLVASDLRPTAVAVASLLGAIGALAGAREAGLTVPAGLSVIAFNDHSLAAHLSPPLTTIRMPNFRMGQEAVQMLLRALEGEPPTDVMLEDEPELVMRDSTAPPAA